MEKQEYVATFQKILEWMSITVNDVQRCMYTEKKDCLDKAQTELQEMRVSALPLIERVRSKEEKNELDRRLLMLVPSLQSIAQAVETILARTKIKCESAILFTDKGMGELAQVIAAVKELARDTRDSFATANPRLKSHARAEMERIIGLADNFAMEHQQRMIVGTCTPQASYLYVDIMDGLKRIVRELAFLAENV